MKWGKGGGGRSLWTTCPPLPQIRMGMARSPYDWRRTDKHLPKVILLQLGNCRTQVRRGVMRVLKLPDGMRFSNAARLCVPRARCCSSIALQWPSGRRSGLHLQQLEQVRGVDSIGCKTASAAWGLKYQQLYSNATYTAMANPARSSWNTSFQSSGAPCTRQLRVWVRGSRSSRSEEEKAGGLGVGAGVG